MTDQPEQTSAPRSPGEHATKSNGTGVAARLARLEDDFGVFKENCRWVAAEQDFKLMRLATALAGMMAQQMQPQIQQVLQAQLLGASNPAPPG